MGIRIIGMSYHLLSRVPWESAWVPAIGSVRSSSSGEETANSTAGLFRSEGDYSKVKSIIEK